MFLFFIMCTAFRNSSQELSFTPYVCIVQDGLHLINGEIEKRSLKSGNELKLQD